MPALIRNGGKLWGVDGGRTTLSPSSPTRPTPASTRPPSTTAAPTALDPATIGTVPNVGLMAQAAEEYGSHDKTFEIASAGTVQVLNQAGDVLLQHAVEPGDIWRATQTKDIAIRDWVKLAVTRARATARRGVLARRDPFARRRTDHEGEEYLGARHRGPHIKILAPAAATQYSLDRIRQGPTPSR